MADRPLFLARARTVMGERFSRGALLRDASGLWFAEAVTLATSVVQGILVARWLGPTSYGIAALVMTYPALIFTFVDARSSEATVKYLGEFRAQGEGRRALAMTRVGYAVDGLAGLLALILVGATALWAQRSIVGAPGTAGLLILFAAAMVVRSPGGTSRAILSTFGRFHALALTRAGNSVVRACVVLGLVAAGFGIRGVVVGSALALAIEGAVLTALALPLAAREWGRAPKGVLWEALEGRRRELAKFIFWSDLNGLLGVFAKQADLVILGYFRGPTEAGYYRLAKSLASVASNAVEPLESVVYPRLARLWGSGNQWGFTQTARRYAIGLGIPLGIAGLIAVPIVPHVIRIFVGEEFVAARLTAQLLVASASLWIGLFWLRPTFLTVGAVRFWTAKTFWVSAVSLIALLIFVPKWGSEGAAWVQLLVNGLGGQLMALIYWWRYLNGGGQPLLSRTMRS